jgi:hypothetical protein
MLEWWTSPSFYAALAAVSLMSILVFRRVRNRNAISDERFDELLRSGTLNPNGSNIPTTYGVNLGHDRRLGITERASIDPPLTQSVKRKNSITTTMTELDNIDR